MQTGALNFQQGDDRWHEYRRKCTEAVPGKFSALYWLNANVLGRSESVPMTYRAHWAMCLFAEGATGFPEIDQARVKMILVPRGVGKSALITEALPIQLLLKNTDTAVGIANEISGNAEDFLGTIKRHFEANSFLRALWPDRVWQPEQLKKTTWTSTAIVIPRTRPRQMSPSILATGVGGTVTGVHLDAWVIDDILSRNAAENARRGLFTEIESTNRWFTQLQPLLASPKRDPIWVIGTYWWVGDTYQWLEGTEEDPGLFGHGEKRQDYLWTLKLPDGTVQTLKLYRRGEMAVFRRPIRDETGRSWFPERITDEELATMQAEDPNFFSSQYLLEPAAGGAAAFRTEWLKHYSFA